MTVEDAVPAKPPRMTPVRRALTAGFFAMLILAAGGMMVSKHVPSPLTVKIALLGAFVCGLWAAWQARDGGIYSPANPRMLDTSRGRYIMTHVWLRVPLMGVFGFAITYGALETAVFGAVTAVIGQPGARTFVIDGVEHGGRSCGHFDVQGAPALIDQALCAPPGQLSQAERGDLLIVAGKVSPFGVNVETLKVQMAPWRTP
jgi:hypothetical protein